MPVTGVPIVRRVTAGVLAFAAAALVPAVILSATTPLFEGTDVVPRIGMLPVFGFFSAAAVALFGIPLFLLFLRFGLVRWWSVLGAGLVGGALVGVIVSSNRLQAPAVLFMSGIGIAAALAFWVVWRLGREPTR
jgi:hypothetical protein